MCTQMYTHTHMHMPYTHEKKGRASWIDTQEKITTNRHVKRCSISLIVIREVQIKTVGCHLIQLEGYYYTHRHAHTHAGLDVRRGHFYMLVLGYRSVQLLWVWRIPGKELSLQRLIDESCSDVEGWNPADPEPNYNLFQASFNPLISRSLLTSGSHLASGN